MRGSSQSNLHLAAPNANGFIAGAKQTTVLCMVRRSRRASLADRPSIRGRGRRGHDHTPPCGHDGRLYGLFECVRARRHCRCHRRNCPGGGGPGSSLGLRSAHNSDLFAEPGQYCFAGEYPRRSHRVCCPGRSSSTLCVKNRDRDEYDQSTAPSSSGSASAESPSSEMATCFRATSM